MRQVIHSFDVFWRSVGPINFGSTNHFNAARLRSPSLNYGVGDSGHRADAGQVALSASTTRMEMSADFPGSSRRVGMMAMALACLAIRQQDSAAGLAREQIAETLFFQAYRETRG
jgi:hypothetical protein